MESRFELHLEKFNGNYLENLKKESLTEEQVVAQLQRVSLRNCYQIGYIFCASESRSHGQLISSQLTPVSSPRLFANTFAIDNLQLICRNLTLAFANLLDDPSDTQSKRTNELKKTLAKTSAVVIFSNDPEEVEKTCVQLEELSKPKPACFFILASSTDINMKIDSNILARIDTKNIETENDSFEFWKNVSDQLTNLADISPKQQSSQKCCYIM